MRTRCAASSLHSMLPVFLLLLGTTSRVDAHQPGVTLSGFGRPTVDGAAYVGEWDSAAVYPFLVNRTIPEQSGYRDSWLLVMNDETNLYLRVFIQRDFLGTISVDFQFDNDHDGTRDGGDDILFLSPQAGFLDRVLAKCSPFKETLCNFRDTDAGGTSDGQGVVRHDPEEVGVVFELSHPLNSNDDRNDLNLAVGDTIGFSFVVTMCWPGFPCAVTNVLGTSSNPLGDIRIAPVPPGPRSSGFWKHQCSNLGFHQIPPPALEALLSEVATRSSGFLDCADAGCGVLQIDPPANDMREKAAKEFLALWLNIATDSLLLNAPIDLRPLTDATTVGGVLWEIAAPICEYYARRSDLEKAKDIAEALNLGGEDFELAAVSPSVPVRPGENASILLGLINMSPGSRSYEFFAAGGWPVHLSPTDVNDLGSGQVGLITAFVNVPAQATGGERTELLVTGRDSSSLTGLERNLRIELFVPALDGSGVPPEGEGSGEGETVDIRQTTD